MDSGAYMINEVLRKMGCPAAIASSRFTNEEDGEAYDVWRVQLPDKTCVLKRAKGNEPTIFDAFSGGSLLRAKALCNDGRMAAAGIYPGK